MAQKGRYYRVHAIGVGLGRSYPLREVKSGTVVQSLESAPQGSLDVIDVLLPNGKVKNVYSFQLQRPIKKPKSWI